MHLTASMFLNDSRIKLDEEDAEKLGKASANVARFYAPKLVDPKTAAILGLAQVAAPIYGKILWDLFMEKRPKPAPTPEGVRILRPNV